MRLYVHVPFCAAKCFYCSFYSLNTAERIPEYLAAVRKEFLVRTRRSFLERYSSGLGVCDCASPDFGTSDFLKPECLERLPKPSLESIYIGGGTPSVLSAEQMDTLLASFAGCCRGEYTVEMNPETVTADRLEVMKRRGVNRISLGVQCADDAVLKRMGRRHTFRTVTKAVREIRKAGFSNLSLDYITGVYGQTEETALRFIRLASEYADHVSVYTLEYSGKKIPVLDEDEERRLYHFMLDQLEKAGFERYEISNFAKNRKYASHNLAYWNREEYLGLGPGASSFLGEYRLQNLPNLNRYLAQDFAREYDVKEMLDEKERRIEELILPLRTSRGVHVADYQKKYGADLPALQAVRRSICCGYMVLEGGFLKFTRSGFDISNHIYTLILDEL